jgi:hypothetical protein
MRLLLALQPSVGFSERNVSDTIRVCAPDGAVRAVVANGREYTSRDGVYELPYSAAQKLLAEGGFQANALRGKATGGFDCECGFGSWFSTCSRCGRELTK